MVLWGRLLRLRALPFKETAVFQETGEAKYSGFKKILESESLETWRCAAIGMPTGGYSNKSEWDEVLTFPISGKPVVTFMWNIGQTIRPNGEVLEGNPPKVNEYMPLTADNHKTDYDQLMERTRAILEQQIRGHRTGPTK